MSNRDDIRGVDGLKGREPIGCVVSVGRKSEKGHPTDNNRFYIMEYKPSKKIGGRPARNFHPRYAKFNDSNDNTTIWGNLIHRNENDAFHYSLLAYKSPDTKNHPDGKPFCVGDGKKAKRWIENEDGELELTDIVCGNQLCKYQSEWKGSKPCSPRSRLIFQLRWGQNSNLPCLIAMWNTKAWSSTQNIIGMFDHAREAYKSLRESYGVQLEDDFMGIPFQMQLGKATKPSRNQSYPVVTFSIDGSLIQHTMKRLESLQQMRSFSQDLKKELPGPVVAEPVEGVGKGEHEKADQFQLSGGDDFFGNK